MPCGCDDIPVDGRWRKASFGGDRTPCEIALEQRGDNLVGFARVYLPGRTAPVFVWHRVDLAALEDELEDAAEERAEARAEPGIAEISGRKARRRRRRRRRKRRRARRKARRKRMFGKLKKVAKKIGKNKVVRGIAKGVKKVVNNPLVKAAMSATPVGAAFVATQTAAKVAKKAIKGGKKARSVIKKTHSAFKRGNPKAARAMRLFRRGAKGLRGSRVAAAMAGDGTWDEWHANEVFVGACIGAGEVVYGAADATDDELEALVTFSGDDWAHARVGRGMGRRSRSRARAAPLRVGDDRPRHGMGASRSRALARGGVTRY